MRRRKAFTLVELLVVIAIVSMLVGILMPSLARAREIARRAVCRKNCHSIGEALNTYAAEFTAYPNVYSDRGGAYMVGSRVTDPNYSLKGNSCNLYLLVRRDNLGSRAFLCPSTGYRTNPDEKSATDDDFRSYDNLSYSFHVQRPEQSSNKERRPLALNSNPSMVILADRTPISGMTSWSEHSASGGWEATPTSQTAQGGTDHALENSFNHEQEGQNALYRDGHVEWRAGPACGVESDNIWTWDDGTDQGSTLGRYGGEFRDACAAHRRDSFLWP